MADQTPTQLPILDRYKWLIMGITAVLIAAALGYLMLQEEQPVSITINPPLPTATITPTGTLPPTETPTPLEIYITGEVNQPDSRLSLPRGARVEDAIQAAGGVTAKADLSVVNLAQLLQDGDQIHVPALPPTPAPATETVISATSAPNPTPTRNTPRLVNLNTASQAELEELPSIGEVTAQAIIAYREEHGGFKTIEELMDVEGIGEKTFEDLKNLVTLD